jgi:hypothetical protein
MLFVIEANLDVLMDHSKDFDDIPLFPRISVVEYKMVR